MKEKERGEKLIGGIGKKEGWKGEREKQQGGNDEREGRQREGCVGERGKGRRKNKVEKILRLKKRKKRRRREENEQDRK